MNTWTKLRGKIMDNQTAHYYNNDLAFDISTAVIDARINRKMSQEQLAKKVNTQQSGIARLESGNSLPSLTFLKRIADVLDMELLVELREKS